MEQSTNYMNEQDKEIYRECTMDKGAEILLPALYLAAANAYKGFL